MCEQAHLHRHSARHRATRRRSQPPKSSSVIEACGGPAMAETHGRPATSTRCCFVAVWAASHGVLLWSSARSKRKLHGQPLVTSRPLALVEPAVCVCPGVVLLLASRASNCGTSCPRSGQLAAAAPVSRRLLKSRRGSRVSPKRQEGNDNVDNLEPEDVVALTIASVAMAEMPLAGTNWIPVALPGHVGPPPGGAPGRAAGTGGLRVTAE